MTTRSYCLDVYVGRNEQDRENLIAHLKANGASFGVTKGERGMWDGTKILRVLTQYAQELGHAIYHGLPGADDYQYVIHEFAVDARRSNTYLPDIDTKHGCNEFDIYPPKVKG